MKITAAKWSAGKLTLETNDPEAIRFAIGFEAGEYELAKAKKKRSRDANALYWTLLDKLAAKLNIPKTELYRNAVREVGGNCDTVCVLESAADALCKGWEHNGLGWIAETFPSKLEGCVNVNLYYGSSTFDTATMSRLIDNLVQDCKALEIEVEDERKIQSLLEAWDDKRVRTGI